MKILYVTTISNTVNAFLIPHIKLLIEQGHQVDVAFKLVQEISPEISELGCKIHNIEFQRSPLKRENFNAYKKIKKIVKEEGYELVHTHTPIASFLTRLACRNIPNLKMLYTAHGFHFFKSAPLKNWLIYYTMESIAARWTDAIITINKEDFRLAKKIKLRKENSVYKINGVGIDLNKFSIPTIEEKMKLRKEYNYQENDFILFYAAELNYNKHQDLLIDAVNIIKNGTPNVKLLLAGTGPYLDKYSNQVKNLGLEKDIKFLGYVKDVPKYLKISDIAVASSRREGLPVNIMEAMASGIPCVVTNSRGHIDLIKDNYNGYVVKENSCQEFFNKIQRLIENKDLYDLFKERSSKKVIKYSTENVLEQIKEIYREIVF